jgi:hypothetical protein
MLLRKLTLLCTACLLVTPGCDDDYDYDEGCATPLVLSFDRGPVEYVAAPGNAYFELGQHDFALTTDWPTAKTPWLAMDLDGDERITGGHELFGSETRVRGRKARNGFLALSALDTNGDGVISHEDDAWDRLLLWRDIDANRRSSADELESVRAANITWISLRYERAPTCNEAGDCEVERSLFGYLLESAKNGVVEVPPHEERVGEVIDIYLRPIARKLLDVPPGKPSGSQGVTNSCL